MAGKGIGGPILHPRDMHHREPVPESPLLEVAQSHVADVKGAVAEDLQEGVMVDCDGQVVAAKNKVACHV